MKQEVFPSLNNREDTSTGLVRDLKHNKPETYKETGSVAEIIINGPEDVLRLIRISIFGNVINRARYCVRQASNRKYKYI